MIKPKKRILKYLAIAVAVSLVVLIVLSIMHIVYAISVVRSMLLIAQLDEHEDYKEIIDIPESDVNVSVRMQDGPHSDTFYFYYTDKNGEEIHLGYGGSWSDQGNAPHPFETGDYEVSNNQNGTFTVRWHNGKQQIENTFDIPTE